MNITSETVFLTAYIKQISMGLLHCAFAISSRCELNN